MPTVRPWRLVPFAAALVALALLVATFSSQPVVAGRGSGVAAAAADLETVDPADVGLSAERLERLDAGLQAMVDDGELAGTVALLARRGKIAFVDVAGVQDIESGRPMARDSIFRIFSMTKLELPQFRGHLSSWRGGGVHDAEVETAVPGGIPTADGRAGSVRTYTGRAGSGVRAVGRGDTKLGRAG